MQLKLNSQLPSSNPGDYSQWEKQSGISGALYAWDATVSPCRHFPPCPFPAKQLSLEHGPDTNFQNKPPSSPLPSFLPSTKEERLTTALFPPSQLLFFLTPLFVVSGLKKNLTQVWIPPRLSHSLYHTSALLEEKKKNIPSNNIFLFYTVYL